MRGAQLGVGGFERTAAALIAEQRGWQYGLADGKAIDVGACISGARRTDRREPPGIRIDDGHASLRLTDDEAHPRGERHDQPMHRPARTQRFGNRYGDAYRKFLRAIPGDLAEQMTDARIAEAREYRGDVMLEVETRRVAEAGSQVFGHEHFDELRKLLISHGIGNRLVPAQ